MPGLILHTSNRLEILADGLARVLRQPLRSPLEPETVVVQSQGMARWLALELAQSHGIWANGAFPFPNAFCRQVFQALVPGAEAESPFTREVMVWKIMGRLPKLAAEPGFEEVRHYLGDQDDGRKRFQLAARLAHLFDQYLIHRPEWLTRWESGHDPHWQARLWRELAADATQKHLPAQFVKFAQRVARLPPGQAVLPERVSVFGVAALPPFHLAVLATLARRCEVHCFLLQPSPEYWGLVAGPREQQRILRRVRPAPAAAEDFHLESGNRLLASMGKLGRDFLNLILDAGDGAWDEQFVEPAEDTLLHAIQADIFHLRDRGRLPPDFGLRTSDWESQSEGAQPAKLPIGPQDRSIQIHSCHSPMRELEVLYDHLLDWFERDPTLAPRDVLVMTPDIDAYAPFIQAVFDAPEEESWRVPFTLADRSARRQSQVVDTFLTLLDLPASRLTTTQTLAPLETRAVRERFGLTEADAARVRDWVRETNIRWGIDAAHRQRLGLPAWPENTWRHGLDRLLLGYAMAGRGDRMFGDILPFDEVEGDVAETLGGLAAYLAAVFRAAESLQAARPVAEWGRALLDLLAEFFLDDDDTHAEMLSVRAALRDLSRNAALAGFVESVDLAVVLEPLRQALQEDRFGSGFLSGGVTFCSLKPMRSIPFKIICLIGMNDTAFPRSDRRLAFNLMAQEPRPGDRSVREDDRYLFLETLLSARDRLYLSYVGQSIRDNSPAPPSALVSELMEYIAQGFELADASSGSAKARPPSRTKNENESLPDILTDLVVTNHRLQAFSPAYFDGADPRLFSFSAENCAAGELARGPRSGPKPFFTGPLGEPEPEFRRVDLAALVEFFRNPTKALLTRRLGLRLPFAEEPLEESEPFTVERLDAHRITQELVEHRLARRDLSGQAAALRAAGRLPPGAAGAIRFQGLRGEAEVFTDKLAPFIAGGLLPPVPVDLNLAGFHVTGQLPPVSARGLVGYRCADMKPADLLRHWLHHLAWNAAHAPDASGETFFVAADATLRFREVAEPLEALTDLLDLYWKGLRQPLKFFPRTSHAFEDRELKKQAGGRARREPLDVARATWEGDAFGKVQPERADGWFDVCFRNGDPLDEEFVATARRVFRPLLEHVEEAKP